MTTQSDMTADIPGGFLPIDARGRYEQAFGPVYLNRSRSQIAFRVEENNMNAFGACHGGAMSTFADMQLLAVKPAPGVGGDHTPTISLSIDYLAPARLHDWVISSVIIVKVTRTMLFTQALISVRDEIIARSTAIYRNYPDKVEVQ